MDTSDETPKPIEVELAPESKGLLKSAESASNAIKDDIDDIGDVVDSSSMSQEKLVKEWRAFKKVQQEYNKQLPKIIADEVEKQVKPLVDQLNKLTTNKPKFIYFKWRVPGFDIPSRIYAKIRRK